MRHRLITIALVLLGSTLAIAREEPPAAPEPSAAPSAATTAPAGKPVVLRWREGTQIANQVGRFRITGDRITFYPVTSAGEAPRPLMALENLALERVARLLEDSREPREWSVTGVLYEFRGKNYLLVDRAVVRAKENESWTPPRR